MALQRLSTSSSQDQLSAGAFSALPPPRSRARRAILEPASGILDLFRFLRFLRTIRAPHRYRPLTWPWGLCTFVPLFLQFAPSTLIVRSLAPRGGFARLFVLFVPFAPSTLIVRSLAPRGGFARLFVLFVPFAPPTLIVRSLAARRPVSLRRSRLPARRPLGGSASSLPRLFAFLLQWRYPPKESASCPTL
jgi:hypothetical protein